MGTSRFSDWRNSATGLVVTSIGWPSSEPRDVSDWYGHGDGCGECGKFAMAESEVAKEEVDLNLVLYA